MYFCFQSNEQVLYAVNFALDNWDAYGPGIDNEFPDVGSSQAAAALRYIRDNFVEISTTTSVIKRFYKLD